MSEQLQPGEQWATPSLELIIALVKKPEGHLVPPKPGEQGVLVGPGYHPDGPVVHIGLLHPDGTMLIGSLGLPELDLVAKRIFRAAERIAAGEFDKPEVRQ